MRLMELKSRGAHTSISSAVKTKSSVGKLFYNNHSMSINIRHAMPHDIPDMLLLLEQLFAIEEDFAFDHSRQFKGLWELVDSNSAHVLVAEANKRIIGMCSMQIIISTAEGGHSGVIEDVIVDKEWRHNGIGTSLLTKAEEVANQLELSRLQLLADNHNQPALKFYSCKGWDKTQLICLHKKLKPHF